MMSRGHSVKLPVRRTSTGFTLVEIIIVIVISGIIAVILATIIRGPVEGFDAQVKRAELVDMAESALRRMQRDIHAALPNSIRVRAAVSGGSGNVVCPAPDGNSCAIEMLHTLDGGRYRAGLPGNRLLFDGADTQFAAIGVLQAPPTAGQWLVINNQTTVGANFNAYNCPAAGASHNCVLLAAGGTATLVVMANAFSPILPSLGTPSQHFFIVDTPVTYLCDTTNQTLTRYQSYTINSDHTLRDTDADLTGAGASAARAAALVVGCRFTYQSGPGARGGLVTLELTIQGATANEQIRLLHQVHVYNSP